MKNGISLLILIMLCGCISEKKDTVPIKNQQLSEYYTRKATDILSHNPDSLEYAIAFIDSAILVNPSEANYSLKVQYNVYLNRIDSAINTSNEYWKFNSEGYTMAVTTGLLYDIQENKNLAKSYYKKALDKLSKIRPDHSDIYYKLDKKYIELLIYETIDCSEYYQQARVHKDSSMLIYYLDYLNNLTIDDVKRRFRKF